MDMAAQWLWHAGEALLKAALNPFSFLAWLLLALSCRRRTELERKLFAVRLHGSLGEWLRAAGLGIAGALVLSLAAAALGLNLTPDAVWWTWAAALVLLAFRVRFAGLPAAAACIGALQLVVRPLRDGLPEQAGPAADSLLSIDLASLWMLAALALLVQAVLAGLTVGRGAMPLVVPGKRGKPIGAYQLQGLWLMPAVLAVPADGGQATGAGPLAAAGGGAPWWQAWLLARPDAGAGSADAAGLAAWWPWPAFFDGPWDGGIALLAFPVLAGFAELTVSDLPERRAKRLALRHAAWALVFAAAAVLSQLWPVLLPAAAAAVLLVPEAWQLMADRAERRQSPQFVQRGRGLKVLDVLPGGPAAEMGIRRGETVLRANGQAVDSPDGLHAALRANPAFCRLEVSDANGESRFVQRPLYSGEHHLLGLMPCPGDRVPAVVRWRPLTLWQLLRIRVEKLALPAGEGGTAADAGDGANSPETAGSSVPAGDADVPPVRADVAGLPGEAGRAGVPGIAGFSGAAGAGPAVGSTADAAESGGAATSMARGGPGGSGAAAETAAARAAERDAASRGPGPRAASGRKT